MSLDSDYLAQHDAWKTARLAALKAEDGWLHLTDRIEVNPGQYTVGRSAANDIEVHAGPDHLGRLVLSDDGKGQFDAGEGMRSFAAVGESLPQLKVGDLLLEISSLEGQAALRVRDLAAPERLAFAGIDSFPVTQDWVIRADWSALGAAQSFGIDTISGIPTSVQLTHKAEFTHEGHAITLLPTHWKGGKPMFVIRDQTSGKETYGASRFLIGEVEGDKVILDFNKAFNPPCAFTDFAVCPLPPRENVLPFAVRAGELKLPGSH